MDTEFAKSQKYDDLLDNYYFQLSKYSLTMNVSKESISKFLVENQFDVKLRILSPYSNRILRMSNLHEINFLLKMCWSILCLQSSCRVLTWIWICASLNHCKKMKAEHSRLIPWKHTETLVLLSVLSTSCNWNHWHVYGKSTAPFSSCLAKKLLNMSCDPASDW